MHVTLRSARWPLATLLAAGALAACGGSSKHSTAAKPATPSTPATTTTATTPTSVPSTHAGDDHMLSIFGGGGELLANPVGTLATLKSLGVQAIRIDLHWNNLAPDPLGKTPPAHFDASNPNSYSAVAWASYDNAIGAATADGIKVLLTVGGAGPLWAEGPGDPLNPGGYRGIWKPKPADFGAFMTAVAKRYSGSFVRPGIGGAPLPRVSLWSIWNEPNYGPNLAPQAGIQSHIEISPALYRGLLDAGWSALHATGHGRDTILFGEIAPRGRTVGNQPGNFSGMVPLRFLRALYCVDANYQRLTGTAATERDCPDASAAESSAGATAFKLANPALFQASGLAAHLYPFGSGPPTTKATGLPGFADFADFASLPELESSLDKLQAAYGSHRQIPIYNTEYGYQTDPPEPSKVTPDQAAAYLNESEYLSWINPRLRSYDQYLLTDPPIPQGAIGFETGLLFTSGKPKATFAAFRMPLYLPVTTATHAGPLEVWGCVRPAPDAAAQTHAAQKVEIQFAAGGSTTFSTLKTVPLPRRSCYFDVGVAFPNSGTVRLAWTPPGAAEEFSRTVAIKVPVP